MHFRCNGVARYVIAAFCKSQLCAIVSRSNPCVRQAIVADSIRIVLIVYSTVGICDLEVGRNFILCNTRECLCDCVMIRIPLVLIAESNNILFLISANSQRSRFTLDIICLCSNVISCYFIVLFCEGNFCAIRSRLSPCINTVDCLYILIIQFVDITKGICNLEVLRQCFNTSEALCDSEVIAVNRIGNSQNFACLIIGFIEAVLNQPVVDLVEEVFI